MSYASLEALFTRMQALQGASAILHWDAATMLPPKASAVRGEQLAALVETCHELLTSPRVGEWLHTVDEAPLNDWQRANMREIRRLHAHETALSAELAGAFTRACSASEAFWRQARKDNNFKEFAPYLEKVLTLVREVAAAKSERLGLAPYDALLDSYDPGTTSAFAGRLLDELHAFLPDFIAQVLERQRSCPAPLALEGPFDLEKQRALGVHFMGLLGFDFEAGRLDVSTHPFCGGVPGDVRLTTRYSTENFHESFMGVLHETGHALYEMHLPASWRLQPVGAARGMSMHESQSLCIEMHLARSLEFLRFAAPIIQKELGTHGTAWEAENLYTLSTRVEPGFIRVHADEVTYPLHIILRYRLEKAMIAGDLHVKDLPGAWNDGMRELLGITPPTDALGCMQDIHWPDGSFGYFPAYALGAMTAAQLFAAARTAVPSLRDALAKGNFAPLTGWLADNVHSQASRYSTQELITRATGAPLSTAAYKAHLHARYLP